MRLHPPFFISSHLAPALKIGDGTLSLIGEEYEGHEHWGDMTVRGRTRCTFVLETPDFTHTDDGMRTGAAGDHSTVGLFESFLSFMEACGESIGYHHRTGCEGDNETLFPKHVGDWIYDNLDDISLARSELVDPETGCRTLDHLIEED